MTLFWLLCVCLVLGGLAVRPEARTALGNLRLHLFGVRVRASRPRQGPAQPACPLWRHDFLPPPRGIPRAGP
jgi:hypothetical protein